MLAIIIVVMYFGHCLVINCEMIYGVITVWGDAVFKTASAFPRYSI